MLSYRRLSASLKRNFVSHPPPLSLSLSSFLLAAACERFSRFYFVARPTTRRLYSRYPAPFTSSPFLFVSLCNPYLSAPLHILISLSRSPLIALLPRVLLVRCTSTRRKILEWRNPRRRAANTHTRIKITSTMIALNETLAASRTGNDRSLSTDHRRGRPTRPERGSRSLP